jgi:adenine deaminase
MTNTELKKLIDVAAGRVTADLVIKNCKIVNVYTHKIEEGDIAVVDGKIAGIGTYEGNKTINGNGKYALPGFIDSHIHIESSYVSPEEIGRLLVPHGATTIVADPHEIVNVCGLDGLDYMMEAADKTALDIKYVLPSCVPATPFEHAGSNVNAAAMEAPIQDERIIGLGEFMDFPGVVSANEAVLDKILVGKNNGKLIDGHSPGLTGNLLNAYVAAGIRNDHECSTVKEMEARLARGMYVMLRQGSCCRNLKTLVKGVTTENSRRCILCSDDRQPKTIFSEGHIECHLKMCVEEGVDPITAVQMATLNAAECFRLTDRGAIAPGLRGDIVLVDDLINFNVNTVFIEGKKVASDGKYLLSYEKIDNTKVKGSFHVKDFSKEKLKMSIKSNYVNLITVIDDGVVTKKETATVQLTKDGDFIYNPEEDIVKIAVVERHQNTGNVAVALLKGYGIKEGALALSIAHDSHNIIVVGVNDDDMEMAVLELIRQQGGMVQVKDGEVIASLPMPIGGIMSDQSGEWVDEQLTNFHEVAYDVLRVSKEVEPVMTLCFMSLAVIPEIKLTDMGLFDVSSFGFISIEA